MRRKPYEIFAKAKLLEIDNKALRVKNEGIEVDGLQIATDAISQAEIATNIVFLGRKPPTESRRAEIKNGVFINMTKSKAENIQDALDIHSQTVVANKEAHYDAIQAIIDDVDMNDEQKLVAVQNHDINTGW